MLRLAFRNIMRQWARTLLTLAAIILGVTSLILAGGFVADVYEQLRETTIHSRLGHIQVYRKGYRDFGQRQPYAHLIPDEDRIPGIAANSPHVIDVMQRLNFSALINNGRVDFPAVGEGIEPDKEARLGTAMTILAGRQLRDDDASGILVGQGLADALRVGSGDFVTLLVSTPDGALNTQEFEIVGVFQTFSKEYDAHAVRISLASARDLLATAGTHACVLLLDSAVNTDIAMEQVRAFLPTDYESFAWYELADFYKKTVDLYSRQFGVLQFIILLMVVLSVANSVNMTVSERLGEFGTLQALGQRRAQIFRLILVENVLLGFIGSGAGTGLGIVLALFLSDMGIPMPPPPGSDMGYEASIHVVPSVLIVAFLVGLASPVLAAVLPARRVARTDLVAALQQNV